MRATCTVALLIFIFQLPTTAQSCLPNGITFNTQADVDNFQSNYPGCTTVEGDIQFYVDGGIDDLSGLSVLTAVGGSMRIAAGMSLTSLNGLNNLVSVGGNFEINCPGLSTLDGLSSLSAVGGNFSLLYCYGLQRLDGMPNLATVGGDFEIAYAYKLLSLNGLEKITTLKQLTIRECDALPNLNGLDHLTAVDGLYLENNDVLTSLTNWNDLDTIQYDINIYNHPQLTSISGLKGLRYVGNNLLINQNLGLSNLSGLDSLTRIGGGLSLFYNNTLASLDGLNHLKTVGGGIELSFPLNSLEALESLDSIGQTLSLFQLPAAHLGSLGKLTFIGGDLYINNCYGLTSLSGMDSLQTIGGALHLENNQALTTLDGLEQVRVLGGPLSITDNQALSDCAVLPICRLLDGMLNSITLQHNAPGCNDPAEIAPQCSGVPATPVLRIALKADLDGDCLPDANSLPVAGEQVLLNGNSKTVVTGAGTDGLAWFKYPENSVGTLSMPQFPNPNWSVCQEPISITSGNPGDTTDATLLLAPLVQCPELTVRLDLPPAFRECTAPSTVRVNAQNTGTVAAQQVRIGVLLPPAFELLAANPALAGQDGDTLFFDGGDLAPFASAGVELTVRTRCNAYQPGQTFCWQAFAGLQNACSTAPQADIQLSAVCTGDSLRFTLKNTGNAPTQTPHHYTLIRNLNMQSPVNFILAPQESLSVAVPADGATWRMEATRLDDGTLAATALEGCGGLTPGLISAYWPDKGPLDVDVDCRQVLPENTASNEVMAVPSGIGPEHLLPPNQPVQYTIHFQNTGTDTVTRVLLRDQLPADLDISSFRPVGASHAYTWEIRDGNTLEVLFSGIDLPDSNTNKDASRGYFSFSLAQKNNLSLGTPFFNIAYIIFNYGQPVQTNYVSHRIGVPYPEDQPCGANGINFGSQADVDNFSIDYPGCQLIEGRVTIGPGISNLNGLNQVRSIGALRLLNSELTNLKGLDRVATCGGLYIVGNPSLENLSGLEQVKALGPEGIYVENNPALSSFDGLNGVQSIAGNLTLTNNPGITDLTGLNNLSKIGQSLDVSNSNLTSFSGLEKLDTIGGDMLANNTGMTLLTGLDNLKWIGGNFSLSQNPGLFNVQGLSSLEGIGGSLQVVNNNSMNSIGGLNQLRAIGGGLLINHNPMMYAIGGLKVLVSVQGEIEIFDNTGLATLNGLDRLETVGGGFTILGNNLGGGLNGLDSLRHIGQYLSIVSNPGLPALNGLRQLKTIGWALDINNNPNLVDLTGLEQLDSVGGVFLEENAGLQNLKAFGALRFIGQELSIKSNDQLTSLDGLESLETVGSNLAISKNAVLADLNSLDHLRSVGGSLRIESNPLLTSLSGLGNLDSLGSNLRVLSNASLSTLNAFQHLKSVHDNLAIEDNAALADLQGLNQIATIGQDLSIRSNGILPNLNGLNGLQFVAHNFTIEYNGLSSFTGLENLDSIGGDVWIHGNTALQSCEGLSKLKSIRGGFAMEENTGLQTLDGLEALASVGGRLWIAYYNGMANIQGLKNLKAVGGDVFIHASPNLANLNGLEGLTSIAGNIWIQINPVLQNLGGLNNLAMVGGLLDIEGNAALSSLGGLENLTAVGDFAVVQNNALANLSGLAKLTTVGNTFTIRENAQLIGFDGLENLHSIGWTVFIDDNPVLQSLTGLKSLTTFSGDLISVFGNPNLSECSIYAMCDYLDNMKGQVNFHDNAPGCNTEAEVEAACQSIPVLVEVRLDGNGNCQTDAADAPVANVQVALDGAAQMTLRPSDTNGRAIFKYYETGAFSLHLPQLPTGNWAACQDNITITPGGLPDTLFAVFLLKPLSQCPELTTTLGLPSAFRSCFIDSKVQVVTQNTGAVLAEGVKTAVVLPPVVELVASTPLASGQSGDTLFFELGDLQPFETGTVLLTVKTRCDTFLFGQTLCWEAISAMDNACPTTLPAASEIHLSAACIGDTLVRFTLKNTGDAPTQGPHQYTIIRNDAIVQTGTFSLANQQSTFVDVPADGATYRMEATQFDNGALTATALEHCGGLTPGQITAFWLDKGPLESDFDCRQVVGSFDPNLKSAVPTGAGPDYTITANRPIQYTIDFQNTGTDTAYRVLLRDVLPAGFDLTTFRPGAASHPCTWEIRGNTLDVLFAPIMLPDSNANEPASHGFFSFALDQTPDLPEGTSFQNTASIIFDFNPPIGTNTVYHRIGRLTVAVDAPQRYADLWRVAGNPTRDVATFSALTIIAGEKRFELYDAAGHQVRAAQFSGQAFVFQRDGLPDGVYFFRIGDEQGRWFTGRIVVAD